MRRYTLLIAITSWAVASLWASASTSILPFRKRETVIPPEIPWQAMPEAPRVRALQVLENLTISARGPVETFLCDPKNYTYFLENPHRAVTAWRRLGAKCVSIVPKMDGSFGWTDENGSDLNWQTIYQGDGVHLWFAEGKVKPSPVLPLTPVKALLMIRYQETKASDGQRLMRHQSDIYVHTDNRAVATVAKVLGKTAPQVAEQGLGQLQLFFSGLSWYLERHPDQAANLLKNGEEP